MPVGPEEAAEHETPEESKAFSAIVEGIDELLKLNYPGSGPVNVTFPAYPGYTQRVVDRIRNAYQKAGWSFVAICVEKNQIDLQREPSETFPPLVPGPIPPERSFSWHKGLNEGDLNESGS